MRTRHQRGHVFKKGSCWYLRYRDVVVGGDGTRKRVHLSKRVASIADCPTKSEARKLAEEFLSPLNNGQLKPESTMSLTRFVESVYLPHIESRKRPSTVKGYKDIWRIHLKPRCGEMRLRDFQTRDGERLLEAIARQNNLNRTSVKHIKAVLSGIFSEAKRLGVLNGVPNPMQGVSIPNCKEPEDTHAYSLDEVSAMISALPLGAATVVATAAFTGLRKSELRGLTWDGYDGKQLVVNRSIWNRFTNEPKTRKSKAPVPVIPRLANLLNLYRLKAGNPQTGPMFVGPKGKLLNFDNLARRVIQPALRKKGAEWHGWHAFRRGLATNLHTLGVSDKTIQAILRHSDIKTTLNVYVKSIAETVREAMTSLEQSFPDCSPIGEEGSAPVAVN